MAPRKTTFTALGCGLLASLSVASSASAHPTRGWERGECPDLRYHTAALGNEQNRQTRIDAYNKAAGRWEYIRTFSERFNAAGYHPGHGRAYAITAVTTGPTNERGVFLLRFNLDGTLKRSAALAGISLESRPSGDVDPDNSVFWFNLFDTGNSHRLHKIQLPDDLSDDDFEGHVFNVEAVNFATNPANADMSFAEVVYYDNKLYGAYDRSMWILSPNDPNGPTARRYNLPTATFPSEANYSAGWMARGPGGAPIWYGSMAAGRLRPGFNAGEVMRVDVLDPAAANFGAGRRAFAGLDLGPNDGFSCIRASALYIGLGDDSAGVPVGGVVTANWRNNDVLVDAEFAGPAYEVATATAQGGSVTFHNDGTFTYTPPAGFSGIDTFEYRACDNYVGAGDTCDTATVSILVGSPTAAPDVIWTSTGTTVGGSVAANDVVVSGSTYSLPTPPDPAAGTFVLYPDGTYSFVHRV